MVTVIARVPMSSGLVRLEQKIIEMIASARKNARGLKK